MRKITWQQDLIAYIKSVQDEPFRWGYNDCCTFVANCADVMCDTNHKEVLTGKYDSELSCKKFLIQNHKGRIETAIDSCIPRKDKKFAQRGDVVLFMTDMGKTAGILWSTGVWSTAPQGIVLFPMSHVNIIEAWGV